MSILTALLANWRWAGAGLLAAGLLIAGWTVNQWRVDAGQLKAAKAAHQAALAARIAADLARVELSLELQKAETQIAANIGRAKEVVRVYVKSDPRCDIDASVIRVLNAARANVPPTAPDPASPP